MRTFERLDALVGTERSPPPSGADRDDDSLVVAEHGGDLEMAPERLDTGTQR